jgi:uncharacterized protein (TIGR03437 family)
LCTARIGTPEGADTELSLSSSSSHVKVPAMIRVRGDASNTRFLVATDEAADLEDVVVSATAGSETAAQSFTVLPSTSPRFSASREIFVKSGEIVRFQVGATDAGNVPAAVSASSLPGTARFEPSTSTFEWQPGTDDLGVHEVIFTATLATGESRRKAVRINVGTGVPVLTALRNGAGKAAPAACSPGAVATLEGHFLSSSEQQGGVRVLVNGEYARVIEASTDQVSFLCPALPTTALRISAENAMGVSAAIDAAMQDTAPGIFTVDGPDQKQAVAMLGASGQLAAVANHRFPGTPALPGDTLAVQVTGIDCSGTSQPMLQIGPEYAKVLSVGPSANPGVCMIQAAVPAGISGDSVPLVLEAVRADGTSIRSNTAFIAVDLRK